MLRPVEINPESRCRRTMYFKQILDERCGCASYLVASRQSREAACEEGEPRSPSFTKRTYHCKLGGAGEVFTTKLLAYGREGLSGMTERP